MKAFCIQRRLHALLVRHYVATYLAVVILLYSVTTCCAMNVCLTHCCQESTETCLKFYTVYSICGCCENMKCKYRMTTFQKPDNGSSIRSNIKCQVNTRTVQEKLVWGTQDILIPTQLCILTLIHYCIRISCFQCKIKKKYNIKIKTK